MSRATELADWLTEDNFGSISIEAATFLRDQEKALKQCVEALDSVEWHGILRGWEVDINKIRAALAAAKECLK